MHALFEIIRMTDVIE